MSKPKIVRHQIRAVRRDKQRFTEAMRAPRPLVAVAIAPDKTIAAIGVSRERVADILRDRGVTEYEMFDYDVVI